MGLMRLPRGRCVIVIIIIIIIIAYAAWGCPCRLPPLLGQCQAQRLLFPALGVFSTRSSPLSANNSLRGSCSLEKHSLGLQIPSLPAPATCHIKRHCHRDTVHGADGDELPWWPSPFWCPQGRRGRNRDPSPGVCCALPQLLTYTPFLSLSPMGWLLWPTGAGKEGSLPADGCCSIPASSCHAAPCRDDGIFPAWSPGCLAQGWHTQNVNRDWREVRLGMSQVLDGRTSDPMGLCSTKS